MANTLLSAQKWAGNIQQKLYNSFLMKSIVNGKFEDSFIGVDTVHFERQNDITLSTLPNFNTAIATQNLVQTDEIFSLNQIRYFAVTINIAEDIETHIAPESDMINSSDKAFKEAYEVEVMKEYVSAAYTASWAGVTDANIYEKMIDLGVQMDTQKIPAYDRVLILDPTRYGLLQKRLTITSNNGIVSTESANKIIETGILQDIAGFTVYKSNYLQLVGGVRHALAFQGKPICFAANLRPKMFMSTVAENLSGFWRMVKACTKFGVHTFNEGAIRLVDVQIS